MHWLSDCEVGAKAALVSCRTIMKLKHRGLQEVAGSSNLVFLILTQKLVDVALISPVIGRVDAREWRVEGERYWKGLGRVV